MANKRREVMGCQWPRKTDVLPVHRTSLADSKEVTPL